MCLFDVCLEPLHAPEDEILNLPCPENEFEDKWTLSGRLDRAMGNAYEQIPFDLLVAWLSVGLGKNDNAENQRKLIIGYTALRAAHVVCYAAKIQPLRTLVWAGSKAVIAVLAYNGFKNLSA